jgi:hypothetical protein
MRRYSALVLVTGVILLGDLLSSDTVVSIDPASELVLYGSSNINKFKCKCMDQFPRSTIKFNKGKTGTSATFSNALLELGVGMLDCGNKLMNKDLYKTLKGDEYPEIRIELLQVKQLNNSMLEEPGTWATQTVEAALTIAGVRRILELSVRAQQTGLGRFHFVSDKNVLMTDYGLIPPKALMGTIKVNDLIRIHIDMMVEVEAGM